MTTDKTLVVETNWGSISTEAPSFVAVDITPEFIALLKNLRELADEHDLSEVRSLYGFDWEQIDDDAVEMPEIVVTKSLFWFVGWMKYSDQGFKTESCSTLDWDTLIGAFEEADEDNLLIVACCNESAVEVRQDYLEKLANNEIV